jgi:ATP-dependent helicase/nuclease subunit B
VRLSAAGARAVLDAAIARARHAGRLPVTARVAETLGFRRRLRARVAAWTRAERSSRGPAPDPSAEGREAWAVFQHYRALLRQLKAEDTEGHAAWASKALQREPGPQWQRLGWVMVLDPIPLAPARTRFLEHVHEYAEAVHVTLPFDPDPALAEAYATVAPVRDRLLDWGFQEVPVAPDAGRPEGLAGIERELFREEGPRRPQLTGAEGVVLRGAPQGEGLALVVARRVRDLLDQGTAPEEILVLCPTWDEEAALIAETLQSWGIAAAADARRALASAPPVAALALAMSVPSRAWETEPLIRLLRNSQLHPNWPEARRPHALAETAMALRETRVFRGREAIRDRLGRNAERTATRDSNSFEYAKEQQKIQRAQRARQVFDRLITLFDEIDRPGCWALQVDRLRHLAESLGIGTARQSGSRADRAALECLWNALDDQGEVLRILQGEEAFWSWAEFTSEVERLIRDLPLPPSPPSPGAVRLTTVDEAAGARASYVLLCNLAEGTFPAREALAPELAVVPDPDADGSTDAPRAAWRGFAREMFRFLRVVGSAGQTLDLLYPTTDENGQALLAAGFLDDVRRLFAEGDAALLPAPIRRLDPARLLPELAGSPRDARVRAVKLACDGNEEELIRIALAPEHRAALLGTAAALRVAHHRFHRRNQFGRYDGIIGDWRALACIESSFLAFSPSQLESLVFCPFQFFLRYVLRLEPVDEREEFDDDRIARGSLIHSILERLHKALRDGPQPPPVPVADSIRAAIRQVLDEEPEPASDVDAGLRAIEAARLERAGERYAHQYQAYLEASKLPVECRSVELEFGPEDAAPYPSLVLGQGPLAIRLRGKIDRIDQVRQDGRIQFRVIDYKTGKCPSPAKVRRGDALQLPLYTLAVKRIVLAEEDATPRDFGYWSLDDDAGYKPIPLKEWETFRERLEAFVLAWSALLRAGTFPIAPRQDHCTRYCDYRSVCRIGQIKAAGKVWAGAPRMEADA